jgi:hypothetical protein
VAEREGTTVAGHDPDQGGRSDPAAEWLHLQMYFQSTKDTSTMAIHKKILQWQVDNPTITWIVWGIIWLIVFYLLFKSNSAGSV